MTTRMWQDLNTADIHNTRYHFHLFDLFKDAYHFVFKYFNKICFCLYIRLTYSDLCTRVPESKFRECLLATLAVPFQVMCSYHAIMNFSSNSKV